MENPTRFDRVFRLWYNILGWICLFFALVPALLYGIFHSGVFVLFCASAVLFLLACWWTRIAPLFRRILLCLIAAALVIVGVFSALMIRQSFRAPPENATLPVIILGGKINGDQPSLMLTRRLLIAEEYLNAHPDAVCVVTGGQGPDEDLPEAEAMARWLTGRGMDPDRVLIEPYSVNTEENLAFSAALLGYPSQAIIATDGFHQLRGAVYAGMANLDAYSISSETPWGLLPCYWIREWMALPVAWLKTNQIL